MTEEKQQRNRVYQVSSNREKPSHKLRYVEASQPAEQDCRLCVGSLAAENDDQNKFSIAHTVSADIARVAFLEKQFYGKQAYPVLFFYQALQQWPATFLTIKDDERTAGYSLMVPISGSSLSLMSLLIGKLFQGRGLGKQLLQQSIVVARSLSYQQLELSVSPDNKSAIALYENFGFKPTKMLTDYLGPSEDRLLMTLLLTKL
ncbi:GNAT family N-acetyltransferase [Idiomarina aminovorans]|uniref:GNAT family N-acetyltransferase n=1 Tax=Idiomarina aminovorans TaxID=2914829 RepID=UPI0020042289|nr:N-acetyltransferase [Idiomarina sp. ATCH4]MCK7458627.1 GNAT family N-acetyltransferase [Idiomarina sp. ATCH4]